MTPTEARDYLAILIEDAYERHDLSDEEYKIARLALKALTPDPTACKCGRPGTTEFHPCPYQQDVHNNGNPYCNCCDDCQGDCVMEI